MAALHQGALVFLLVILGGELLSSFLKEGKGLEESEVWRFEAYWRDVCLSVE